MSLNNEINQLCVSYLRVLAMDTISNAKSGHPGAPLGLAPTAHVLFSKYFNFEIGWPNRDRFIMSCGHAVPLLYSVYHIFSNNKIISIDDLKCYRKMGSKTSGSTERHINPYIIECSTGPLGQGVGNAVGFSCISLHLQKRFNKNDLTIFNNRIWCFCSDGDIMSGVQAEAASFAGHQKLNNLIMFWDDNKITLSGSTEMTFSEDVLKRYEAYGWHTIVVNNADTDLDEIDRAIQEALKVTDKPVLIDLHTTIGYGSESANNSKIHGTPMSLDQVARMKEKFGCDPNKSFYVSDEVYKFYSETVQSKVQKQVNEWNQKFETYKQKYPNDYKVLDELMNRTYDVDYFKSILPSIYLQNSSNQTDNVKDSLHKEELIATRIFSGEVINLVHDNFPGLIGGSADLTPTNNTALSNEIDFDFNHREGRYIEYGIREHGMQAIANGIACYGFSGILPFTATFLAFYHYMLAPIRVAAVDSLRTITIATHDSIGVGEDGALSQPIECLAQLRSMPNTLVYRPCDRIETAAGYATAVTGPPRPAILAFSRQPTIIPVEGTNFDGALKGGYIIREFSTQINNKGASKRVIIISSGTEVVISLKAADLLKDEGVDVRVVSMPSMELFRSQSVEYRNRVLPRNIPILSVEASVSFGWREFSHRHVGTDKFGFSAPFADLYRAFGITPDGIADAAKELIHDTEEGRIF
ncbi:Transketolase 1 [Tritrichomonas foetus]|uniref:transketolase n=1 Tax=Tritrichomonas foetus TaxID=1144522 RepID=A0A1J4J640_9EUKA|nr:Transketolase 1 [Tritrichomonas foetus]|eukprot:OHS94680.1 Transketolase 1 [Tritrichomonas foetus]